MKAVNLTSGKELAHRVAVAETLVARAKGLLGRRALPRGEGLLIRPCMGVHSFFMKFPIDVVFLDRQNRVVAAVENLKPQRITRIWLSSVSVIEVPAGAVAASETVVGNQMVIE
jgi:uncharacterized protein